MGLTAEDLLEQSGVDRYGSWLSRLENTRTTAPQMREFAPICRVLGIDPVAAASGSLVLVAGC